MNHHDETILGLERRALHRWGKGDPSGYLDLSSTEVSYFDPMYPRRIDGIHALSAYYEPFKGLIQIDRDEIVNPRIQFHGDVAILTFQFRSEGSEGLKLWNCTEVYIRAHADWKIAYTHWSFATGPRDNINQPNDGQHCISYPRRPQVVQ